MQNAHDASPLPESVWVTIEVPRGAFIKRDAAGNIDLISPLPAPFNYGRVDAHHGGDGEPRDAVVLGTRLPRNTRVHLRVWGEVQFQDGTAEDNKWVCAETPPTPAQEANLQRFFSLYAVIKRTRDRFRRHPPDSRFLGWVRREEPDT